MKSLGPASRIFRVGVGIASALARASASERGSGEVETRSGRAERRRKGREVGRRMGMGRLGLVVSWSLERESISMMAHSFAGCHKSVHRAECEMGARPYLYMSLGVIGPSSVLIKEKKESIKPQAPYSTVPHSEQESHKRHANLAEGASAK